MFFEMIKFIKMDLLQKQYSFEFMQILSRLCSDVFYLHLRAKFISAEEKTGITFDDFAGQEYIKRELQEIVKILKDDEEFQNKGIYCPKGVLLHGPPGTGKTLLAKAIAGEAGLPFFAANGTDFVEVRFFLKTIVKRLYITYKQILIDVGIHLNYLSKWYRG